MKLTIYHAATDGPNCGIESHAFATEAERNDWLKEVMLESLGPVKDSFSPSNEEAACRELIAIGKIGDAFCLFEDHLKDPLDTYALDITEIEVPDPQPPKYYAVTGRIPGDSEDSVYCFDRIQRHEAKSLFTTRILEDTDFKTVEDCEATLGSAPFINVVLESDSPIRVAYECPS